MSQSLRSPLSGLLGSIVVLGLGMAIGVVGIYSAELELRWLVYIGAVIIFVPFFLMLRNQEAFIWSVFLLVQQAPVALWVLYGYGGSDGIPIYLASIPGVALVLWYLFTGRIRSLFPLVYGGPLAAPFAALGFTYFSSLLWSDEKFIGISNLIQHGQLFLYFWLAANRVKTFEQLEQSVHLLFSILLTQSIIYCLQSTTGITFDLVGNSHDSTAENGVIRPGGTVSYGPHGFAGFILPIMLVLITKFIIGSGSNTRKWVYGGIILVGSIAMALTVTRAYYVAYLLGMIVIFTLAYRRGYLAMKTIVISSASFLGVFAAFAVPLLIARMQVVKTAESYDERYALMRIAVNVIQGNPIFGVGPGAYDQFYKHYITPDLAGKWLWTVHNNFLLRGAEMGIPGLLAFLWLLIQAYRHGLTISSFKNGITVALGIGLCATLLEYCWNMWWEMGTFFAAQGMFCTLMGLAVAAYRIETQDQLEGPDAQTSRSQVNSRRLG